MSGKILKIAGKTYTENANTILDNVFGDKGITNNIGGRYHSSAAKDHIFGEYEEIKRPIRKAPESTYAIKTIEILNLDEGSDNEGTGGTKEGMIYGKEYKLKVKKYFDNKKPKDLSTINWEYTYTSEDGNVVIGAIKEKGEEVSFKTDDLDLCGKEITFYAYIEDKEQEASLDVFHHYRFRWFDRKIVLEQVKNRAIDPWKINQGSSSLCGMASLFYLLAKKDSDGYQKLAKELHQKGEVKYGDYIIKPHSEALEMYDMNPTSSSYRTVSMPYIDWIVLATTRSKESLNNFFVYKGIETGDIDMLKAVNWPRMMERMTKELIGYTSVDTTGLNEFLIQQKKRPLGGKIYDKYFDSDLKLLEEIETKFNQGKQIIMMIDAGMISNDVSYSYSDITNDSHWVVYEGGLKFFDENEKVTTKIEDAKEVTFKIYTWGYNPNTLKDESGNYNWNPKNILIQISSRKILTKSFKSNFYGYIEAS